MNYLTLLSIPVLMVLLYSGCSRVSDNENGNLILPGLCMAYDCHNSTQLKVYPPVSGAHLIHTGYEQIGVSLQCQSCHKNYLHNPLHKNGFINGFNWIYNVRTTGKIVYPGPGVDANMEFDTSTNTCAAADVSGGCHLLSTYTHNWYFVTPESCSGPGTCHDTLMTPDPPNSGEHTRHLNEGIGCTICHFNYFKKPIHRNGVVNGSGLSGRIVYFIIPFASFNASSGECFVWCHESENW